MYALVTIDRCAVTVVRAPPRIALATRENTSHLPLARAVASCSCGEVGSVRRCGGGPAVAGLPDGIGERPPVFQRTEDGFVEQKYLGHEIFDRDIGGIFSVENVRNEFTNGAAHLDIIRAEI